MHFKSGQQEPKATLEIGANTYKIYAPTLGQSDKFSAKYNEAKDKPEQINALMREYICELGSIPLDEIGKIEAELFTDLFSYVITPSKKK